MKIIKIVLIIFILANCFAKSSVFNYSQPVDILNYFDYISKEFGTTNDGRYQEEWIKINGEFSSEDKKYLKSYRALRNKYKARDNEFDKFSVVFYRETTIDKVLKKLSTTITKEETKEFASFLKHFKDRASVFIKQSSAFSGKVDAIETKYKRLGLFKSFDQTFKFFDLKKSFMPKIFFVWAPEKFEYQIDHIQNIIIFKINPIKDLDDIFSDKFLLDNLVQSLFKSLSITQIESFTKTLNKSCEPVAYNVLKYVLGYMHYDSYKEGKKFDPYIDHFPDKKAVQLALNFHHLYEYQLKSKMNFFGSFANKVEYLCSLSK